MTKFNDYIIENETLLSFIKDANVFCCSNNSQIMKILKDHSHELKETYNYKSLLISFIVDSILDLITLKTKTNIDQLKRDIKSDIEVPASIILVNSLKKNKTLLANPLIKEILTFLKDLNKILHKSTNIVNLICALLVLIKKTNIKESQLNIYVKELNMIYEHKQEAFTNIQLIKYINDSITNYIKLYITPIHLIEFKLNIFEKEFSYHNILCMKIIHNIFIYIYIINNSLFIEIIIYKYKTVNKVGLKNDINDMYKTCMTYFDPKEYSINAIFLTKDIEFWEEFDESKLKDYLKKNDILHYLSKIKKEPLQLFNLININLKYLHKIGLSILNNKNIKFEEKYDSKSFKSLEKAEKYYIQKNIYAWNKWLNKNKGIDL